MKPPYALPCESLRFEWGLPQSLHHWSSIPIRTTHSMKKYLLSTLLIAMTLGLGCGDDKKSKADKEDKEDKDDAGSSSEESSGADSRSDEEKALEVCESYWTKLGELTGHPDYVTMFLDRPQYINEYSGEETGDSIRDACIADVIEDVKEEAEDTCTEDYWAVVAAYLGNEKYVTSQVDWYARKFVEGIENITEVGRYNKTIGYDEEYEPEVMKDILLGKKDSASVAKDYRIYLSISGFMGDIRSKWKFSDLSLENIKSGTRVDKKERVAWPACEDAKKRAKSGGSSSSSGKKQNGQIPGYSACTKRYEGTQVPVSVCCTEVGGKIVKGGSFPVCEK